MRALSAVWSRGVSVPSGLKRLQGRKRREDAGQFRRIAPVPATVIQAEPRHGASEFRTSLGPGGSVVRKRPLGHHAMSVRPVLKRLHSPDAHELHTFTPVDRACFGVLVQAMFGPDGGEGEESFDVLVCTPTWLAREVERMGLVDGRHHLIVHEFNLERIRSFLVAYASTCAGETWQEVAAKLCRLGKWEFEDYAP